GFFVGEQQVLLAVVDHVLDRCLDLVIRAIHAHAARRHGADAVDGMLDQCRFALCDTRCPSSHVTGFRCAGSTRRMAGHARCVIYRFARARASGNSRRCSATLFTLDAYRANRPDTLLNSTLTENAALAERVR